MEELLIEELGKRFSVQLRPYPWTNIKFICPFAMETSLLHRIVSLPGKGEGLLATRDMIQLNNFGWKNYSNFGFRFLKIR